MVVHVPRRSSESELVLRDATIRLRCRYILDYNIIVNTKSERKKKQRQNVKPNRAQSWLLVNCCSIWNGK
jgi:hypothetical protein